MRSGFSAAMTRDKKAVVLRSEQCANWLGRTFLHRVVAPFAKCISATCSILNWPFTPKLSLRLCADAEAKQRPTKDTERRKKSNNLVFVLLSAIVMAPVKSRRWI
ncbi:hypothetical protein Bca52824_040027 [Brassica carinata]|uniref:Uncharacterized protein n=1 Tax=Brassica carinata TaxID=52824 RepID=A0A8X7RU40_BRACI|nr:hypothetical protein Bca52824_040027 [Brassica carinata]